VACGVELELYVEMENGRNPGSAGGFVGERVLKQLDSENVPNPEFW
jgi:hypothetical protein